ncbi:MFS transporter [Devosia rhizoryzae]|uniref:Multidrug efflux pump Tap n=1 Tax=Devosia rhizoryzae TaxID=2774137 RepID=A0ABX7C9Z3_9HYPH|nr:MFS transporter [Devosia rhizoryzae]QQR40502.1 MFS transporter [Devosia rhizoryzae]
MTRHGPLAVLAAATVISVGGTRLSTIAIPWLVLTTTGNPVLTGLVGLAEMLPYVVAKALSGPLIDRRGAKRMSILSDLLSMFAVAIVPVLFWSGLLSIWLLLPAVALIGILRAPSDAAKQALVPAVAESGSLPMERVTGILGASERLAGTLGAAGAGALIAFIGPAPALIVNAGAFGVSALVLWAGLPKPARVTPDLAPYGAQLAEGWSFLLQDKVLVSLVIMVAITNLLDQAYAVVLLPVWVRSAGFDAGFLGLLFALFSGASIAGAAVAAAIGQRLPRLTVYTVAFLLTGLPRFAVFAFELPTLVILATITISGLASGFLNPIISAIMFERIPSRITGRVVALIGSLTWILLPFGGLYAGILVEGAGLALAWALSGALYFLVTLAPIAVPSFRDMRRRLPLSTV